MRNVTVFIEALLRRTLLTARNDRWRPSGDEGDLVSRGGSCRLGAFYRRAVARIALCMSIHTREARKAVSFEA